MGRAVLTVWDEETCSRVHEATKQVLATTGVEIRGHEPSLGLFGQAGTRVDGTRVGLHRPALLGSGESRAASSSVEKPSRAGSICALWVQRGAVFAREHQAGLRVRLIPAALFFKLPRAALAQDPTAWPESAPGESRAEFAPMSQPFVLEDDHTLRVVPGRARARS